VTLQELQKPRQGYRFITFRPRYVKLQIPDNWNFSSIEKICKTSSGGTPSRDNPDFFNGNIPWIKTGELNDGYLNKTEEHISEEALSLSSAKKFPPKTVMVAMYGATIGKTCITTVEATTNQACCALIPIHENLIEPYFLQQYLILRRPLMISLGEGAGQPNTIQDFIRAFQIAYPCWREQLKISLILSSVDRLVEKTDQVIEQTQRLKEGLVQTLLTKGIGHSKFKNTTIGEIPEKWDVVKLGEVLNLCQYGISEKMSAQGQYPIFRMNNIEDGYLVTNKMKFIDLDKQIFEQYKLDKGDLLFNRTNSYDLVGKVGLFNLDGEYTFASYLIRLRTIQEKMNPFFLHLYLNTDWMQYKLKNLATAGVGQVNINATNLKTIKIAAPSSSEQEDIVSVIYDIEEKLTNEKKRKIIIEKLKKGLMQKLLTGKIRVKV
jgi:type I restriction enzyme, S subunit